MSDKPGSFKKGDKVFVPGEVHYLTKNSIAVHVKEEFGPQCRHFKLSDVYAALAAGQAGAAPTQFEQWNRERDHFELSWCSNASFMLAQLPADIEALKEFAWHVWQHAVSSARRAAGVAPGSGRISGCPGGQDCVCRPGWGHKYAAPTSVEAGEEVEVLAAKFHEIYQQEAKRQGDVRHQDAYADLPENIKEFDRVLARYVIAALAQQVPTEATHERQRD